MQERADIRVGILGCGMISADHFRAWARCQGASVVAVCDPDRGRAEAQAKEFGIGTVYTAPEAMLAAGGLDAVDIITPRQTHAPLVRLAAEYGVHALCEKPLCPTHAEAQALVQAVGGRVHVMVNENWRFRAYFRQIGDWIRAGRLGTLVQARLSLWRSNLIPRPDGTVIALQRQPFVATEPRYLVAESLIHELDTVRSLFGEMEVVSARLARASTDIVGEDAAAILLETRSGMPLVVEGVLSAAGHAPRAPNRMEIAGTRCSVVLEGAVLRLFGAEEEELHYDEDAVRQGSFDASVQHFADLIRDGGTAETSAADQLHTLALVERTYELAGQVRSLAQRAPAVNA
jgi:predicted dehydrogenase